MHLKYVALTESTGFRTEYRLLNLNFWRTNVQALSYILFLGFWSTRSSSQISSSITEPGVEQDRNPLAGVWSFFTERYVLVDCIIWRQLLWLNYTFGLRILRKFEIGITVFLSDLYDVKRYYSLRETCLFWPHLVSHVHSVHSNNCCWVNEDRIV